MTTLITIPSCTAVHVPTPTSVPVPLAAGDLTLTQIPANPPTHPSATITLSVGSASFPLLPISPVQKVKAKQEHASYQFTPIPADGGMAVGSVRINMKDSKSQGEWEATESLCASFEIALKAHGLWDEKELFVNDEYETSGTPVKGWGETVAAAVMGGAATLATRITAFADGHMPDHPKPANPPSPVTAAKIAAVRNSTANLADNFEAGANTIGQKIHDGGKALGEKLPDSIAKKSEPVPEHEKSELRKMAEEALEQATLAAKGIAAGATTVGKSLSENAHKAVEVNYGKQADQVAQDVGQTGANLGAAALSGVKATSVMMQGSNAVSGAAEAKTA